MQGSQHGEVTVLHAIPEPQPQNISLSPTATMTLLVHGKVVVSHTFYSQGPLGLKASAASDPSLALVGSS